MEGIQQGIGVEGLLREAIDHSQCRGEISSIEPTSGSIRIHDTNVASSTGRTVHFAVSEVRCDVMTLRVGVQVQFNLLMDQRGIQRAVNVENFPRQQRSVLSMLNGQMSHGATTRGGDMHAPAQAAPRSITTANGSAR